MGQQGPMKILVRYLVHLVVMPLVALFVILWAFLTFFPQQRFRDYAADALGERIHRQLVIGPVRLGWRGLSLESLKVSEIPHFKKGTLVDAKGIHVGWSLRSLWQGLSLREGQLTQTSGRFLIHNFRHPHYAAQDFSVAWSLSDITQTGSSLSGWAKLRQGKGSLQNIDQLMTKSPSSRAALAPVLALMNLERAGFVQLGLPDLRYWPLDSIEGDYRFDKGTMTIRNFQIRSAPLNVKTHGTMEIASGKLHLEAELHAPAARNRGKLDASLTITGTTAKPKVDLSSLKKRAFQANLTNLFKNHVNGSHDVDNALKGLFK